MNKLFQVKSNTLRNLCRLGDVATYINGYAFAPSDWDTKGLPIIRIQDLTGNSYQANFFSGQIDDRFKVHSGDILISWSASLGIFEWQRGDAVLNQHIFKVVFDKIDIDKYFFVHQLRMLLDRFASEAHGATMKHLTRPVFNALPFYAPSLDKQKKISSILESVSCMISICQRKLCKLDQMAKSRFIELFGDPIENPKGWPRQPISAFAQVKIGPFGSVLHAEDYIHDGYPLVNPSHLHEGKIIVDKTLTISEKKYKELTAYHLHPGDIVIGRRGEIGRCAMVTHEGLFCGTGSLFVRIENCCRPDFLQSVISYPAYKKMLEDKAVGVTMKNINAGMIEDSLIPLPPLALQNEFASFIEELDKSKLASHQFEVAA